ncbi:hypothetical protein EVAR_87077_1 [Eumeta japonica]|uniref:Uncharacterized protein n=1 Tax=Eumeta variegata TaxID=151549 RepID=A0A4C1VSN3_EUMVA|nr:hypothetical protein EVAR_87077_1 [Eumeta japonica]
MHRWRFNGARGPVAVNIRFLRVTFAAAEYKFKVSSSRRRTSKTHEETPQNEARNLKRLSYRRVSPHLGLLLFTSARLWFNGFLAVWRRLNDGQLFLLDLTSLFSRASQYDGWLATIPASPYAAGQHARVLAARDLPCGGSLKGILSAQEVTGTPARDGPIRYLDARTV